MTMARRGRSTKMAESTESAPRQSRLDRTSTHGGAGAHRLQPFDDHLLAAVEAGVDRDAGAGLAAGLDALDDRLAVLDHEHIDAFLVGDQRGLRDDDLLVGCSGLEIDLDELAVDQ